MPDCPSWADFVPKLLSISSAWSLRYQVVKVAGLPLFVATFYGSPIALFMEIGMDGPLTSGVTKLRRIQNIFSFSLASLSNCVLLIFSILLMNPWFAPHAQLSPPLHAVSVILQRLSLHMLKNHGICNSWRRYVYMHTHCPICLRLFGEESA